MKNSLLTFLVLRNRADLQYISSNSRNSIYEFNIDKIGDMLHKIYLTFEVDAIDSTNV